MSKNWSKHLPLVERLKASDTIRIYHEQGVGFLAQDECIEDRTILVNRDGLEAAKAIVELQTKLDMLSVYCHHIGSCSANDLDYLDHTPCTCGLRTLYNPKGHTP